MLLALRLASGSMITTYDLSALDSIAAVAAVAVAVIAAVIIQG